MENVTVKDVIDGVLAPQEDLLGAGQEDYFFLGGGGDGFNASVDCPDYDETGERLIEMVNFWMEGVIQTCIAVPGIIFNIVSSLVLVSREDLRFRLAARIFSSMDAVFHVHVRDVFVSFLTASVNFYKAPMALVYTFGIGPLWRAKAPRPLPASPPATPNYSLPPPPLMPALKLIDHSRVISRFPSGLTQTGRSDRFAPATPGNISAG